jgi:hypothetical protein
VAGPNVTTKRGLLIAPDPAEESRARRQ